MDGQGVLPRLQRGNRETRGRRGRGQPAAGGGGSETAWEVWGAFNNTGSDNEGGEGCGANGRHL